MDPQAIPKMSRNNTRAYSTPGRSAKTKLRRKLKPEKLKKFSCKICSKDLSSQAHLKNHILKKHPKTPKIFVCDFEGKTFNTKDKLRLHVINHRRHFLLSCLICPKTYRTNQSMRKHLRTHFEHHQCESCGQTFKYKRLLQNHIAALHQWEYTISCKYCTRLFPSNTTRDAHQKNIHQDQQVNTSIFKCSECPLGFEMKEELRIHSFIHFDGEIHTCFECNQIFKKRKLLTNHMKMHEVPSYQCLKCNQMFKYRSNLGKHIKELRCKGPNPPTNRNYPSPEDEAELAKKQLLAITVNPSRALNLNSNKCSMVKTEAELKPKIEPDEKFVIETEQESFNTYQQFEVKKEEILDTEKPKRPYRKKKLMKLLRHPSSPYECDLCDFTTDKKCNILSHIRHHAATKRHFCLGCSETFSTRLKLHNHSMKIHGRGVIGSVEYSKTSSECKVCHRVFSDERLKFHTKLHDSPCFTCIECSRMFRNQFALEKHVANHHFSEKRFTCETCGKSFKKLTILKQHEEVHNPIKIYVNCELCPTMLQVKSLKLHMEIKHGDRYKVKTQVCECGKAFRYAKQLEKHYEAVHQKVIRGGIIYPCPDCELTFNRRIDLREHSFEHFSGKIFECNCGMKFKKQKLLTLHSAVHKNVRWECSICVPPLLFQTRGGRRKHLAKMHFQGNQELVEIPAFDNSPQSHIVTTDLS